MVARNRFTRKLFFYYFSIFLLFTALIMLYQYNHEKKIRLTYLNNRLYDMTDLVNNFIETNGIIQTSDYKLIDSIYHLIPVEDLRVTLVSNEGKVLYDSSVDDWSKMENHLLRPEVNVSHFSRFGTAIRKSASTGKEYYYFSRYFGGYYIRLAEEYNLKLRGFLQRQKIFLFFMFITFIIIWTLLTLATRRIGESITMLRDFAARMRRGEGNDPSIIFPDNEIGETGKEIVKIYNNLSLNTKELTLQKEKLFRHLHVLNEGVAFFSPERKVTLSNNLFLVYLSSISGEHTLTPEKFLEMPQFSRVIDFLESHKQQPASSETPAVEFHAESAGRHFSVRCILFNDNSFEIVLTDITRIEQTKAVRQQMTSNIAHELKTPIASVKGYIETLLVNKDLDEEKKQYFLEKAMSQSNRLTDLINDIVTLNKLDEANGSFVYEEVNIKSVVNEVCENLQTSVSKRHMKVVVDIDTSVNVTANRSLVFSIFQNLLENAVNYAGQNVTVTIRSMEGEPGFHNFSFADDGAGIPEEHQARIFERFYRIDDGRARKSGGTGLGLAIVKNAILLHKGDISVRTRSGGGVEFIFSLPR